MRLYLNGARNTVEEHILPLYPQYADYIGWLQTPRAGYNFSRLKATGLPIACDNNAFTGFREDRYLSMLRRADEAEVNIEWVSVPDVVADAVETDNLFRAWQPKLPYPLAYVLQDGVEDIEIPFSQIVCVFIGGTTEFKLSETASDVVATAKKHNKRVHMGRVNTDKRLRYAMSIGCDSVDGTGYVRYRQRELLPALHVIHTETANLQLKWRL